MASFNRVTFGGSTDTISVPFLYLQSSHVHVYLDGVELASTAFTWPTPGQIKITAGAPASGRVGLVKRITPTAPLTAFTPGILALADLNAAELQPLYIAEELQDAVWMAADVGRAGTITKGGVNVVPVFDANGNLVPGPLLTGVPGVPGTGSVIDDSVATPASPSLGIKATKLAYLGSAAAGAVYRTVQDRLRERVSALDFATPIDGIASANAGLTAADAGTQGFYLPVGQYSISANLTLTKHLQAAPGAQILIPDGGVLTLNGGFSAPLWMQVFVCVGSGRVVFNNATTEYVYPEWWGTKVNDATPAVAVANQVAMQRAIDAHNFVILQAAGYYINGTLRFSKSGKKMWGKGWANTTYIWQQSATATTIQIEPATWTPNSFGTYISELSFKHFNTQRTVQPATPTDSTVDYLGTSGFRIKGVIRVQFERVFCVNDILGWYMANTINVDYLGCESVSAWTSGRHIGWYVDGARAGSEATASSNSSSRWTDCLVNAPDIADSYSWKILGRFSDQFLLRPECAATRWGVYVLGNSAAPGGDGQNSRLEIDLEIIGCKADSMQSGGAGIYIGGTTPYGQVHIIGGYCAPAGGGNSSGIYLDSAQGVVVSGFQANGYPAAAFAGVVLNSCTLCDLSGLNLEDCDQPVQVIGGIANRGSGLIYNNSKALTANAAVDLKSSAVHNKMDFAMLGSASGKITHGYRTDAGSIGNELNITGVVAPQVTNRATINGTGTNVAGTFGSNLVTGI